MTPRITLAIVASILAVHALRAGDIIGHIEAKAPKSEDSSGGGAYQSRRYKFLEKIDYADMRDFVVSIEGVSKPVQSGEPRPLASVAQKDGAFEPSVIPIVAGSEIEWPNRDDIYHNVFSMSETRPFDLGMYKNTEEPKRLIFDKVGKIDVFCAIHSQMHCVVLVLPNPWFAKSDHRGDFEIKGVPAGHYTLKAWHERLPTKLVEIDVPENGSVKIDIAMGFADLPKI